MGWKLNPNYRSLALSYNSSEENVIAMNQKLDLHTKTKGNRTSL